MFDELTEAIFNNKSVSNIDDNVSVNESVNESENESEDENENQNVSKNENESVDKIDDNIDKNNYFNIIDKKKSFEDQIEILKKIDDLSWDMNYCDDNKRQNFKIFKLKFAHIWNDVDQQLFKEIFGHTYVALADELLNTTSKEENQIFINDIKKIGIKFTNKMIIVII